MNERPSLTRLTKVELRKMVDTRSGFWLQLSVVGLIVVAVVVTLLAGHERNNTFHHVLANALAPVGVLLPVVGILLVSSEWSQRTALVSFALVPGRSRLVVAKVMAGVLLGLVAALLAIAVAAIGTALASPDIPHVWSLSAGLLLQDLLYVVTAMVIGIGFGAALLSSPPAIVLYFGLPGALGALGGIHSLAGTIEWINPPESLEPLTAATLSGHEWAQGLATLALWMVLPLALGLWRITRGDLS